ncbi:MAG: hypothetical protein ACRDD2_08700 [Sarcina sp.]
MKKKFLKEIENDQRVEILINNFKIEFEAVMDLMNENQFDYILKYSGDIFRKWLYSPLIENTVLTPYLIINSVAQAKNPGTYSLNIDLRIKYSKKSRFKYKLELFYYSEKENPVLKDLEKIVKYCSPILSIKEGEQCLINEGEELVNRLSYRNGNYLKYLIAIAIKMDVLKRMDSIGCLSYQLSKNYEKYEQLSKEEKLKLIIDKSIEYSEESLRANFEYYFPENLLSDFLNNNVDKDRFYNYSLFSGGELIDFVENLDKMGMKLEKEELLTLRNVQKLSKDLGDEFGEYLLDSKIGWFVDLFFTHIFGDYLGIINFVYGMEFTIMGFVGLLLEFKDKVESTAIIYSLENFHDLTLLGEQLLEKRNVEIESRAFEYLTDIEITITMKNYLEELENSIKNEFRNSYLEMEEEDFIITEEIENHLKSFEKYLIEEKHLKEKIIGLHMKNIFLFIGFYSSFENLEEIKNISYEEIEEYLIEWFIKMVATSKKSIVEQIKSLNLYMMFLEKIDFLEEKKNLKIREKLQNKEKYIKAYEQQC